MRGKNYPDNEHMSHILCLQDVNYILTVCVNTLVNFISTPFLSY